jgi:hypothetical protein
LTDVSHRVEARGPSVENLKTNDNSRIIDGYVNCLARRERSQVAPFILKSSTAMIPEASSG